MAATTRQWPPRDGQNTMEILSIGGDFPDCLFHREANGLPIWGASQVAKELHLSVMHHGRDEETGFSSSARDPVDRALVSGVNHEFPIR